MALATVALVLDGVDGRVARRTGTVSAFGARFDMEVDAFLILVLSVCVAAQVGWWVLAIGSGALRARGRRPGAALAATELRRPGGGRKVVAAGVGVVLIVAAAGVLPEAMTVAMLIVAVGLLAESFGRSIWTLWRRAGGRPFPRAKVTAAMSLALVWAALVVPAQLEDLTPGAFLRIPVEGLVFVAVALVLPPRSARSPRCSSGWDLVC